MAGVHHGRQVSEVEGQTEEAGHGTEESEEGRRLCEDEPGTGTSAQEGQIVRPRVRHAPDDLREIAARTLAHYDERAEDFRDGTRGHDVSQNVAALLLHIAAEPPLTLLDLELCPRC